MGRGEGLSEAKLRDLHCFAESDAFSEAEKLALELAACTTRTPAEVPQALFDALRKHFSDDQLVELSTVIAMENYRARFNRPFDVQSENLSEGAFCPLPERPASD